MTAMYGSRYCYASRFDPNELFATADEARKYDRISAVQILINAGEVRWDQFFNKADAELFAVLQFMLQESPPFIRDTHDA